MDAPSDWMSNARRMLAVAGGDPDSTTDGLFALRQTISIIQA
jgi:hypothetical protein